jgi:hypothetical protein
MKPFIPSKLAEVVFGLILGYFGYLHFKNVNMMAGGVPHYLPGDGKIWIYITGGGFILAAIAIITGFLKTLACYLLAAQLIVFVIALHLKGVLNDNAASLSQALKDSAIAMGAIVIGNRKK